MSCPNEFISFAQDLADIAAEVSLGYFRTGLTVDDKADDSPVTIADRTAELRMREAIEARYPAHGILGEEHGKVRMDAEFVWVLDPIDGTKAFITGNPLFGTLIALTQGGAPLMGVISMPALGERWIGARGHPTRFQERSGSSKDVWVRSCPELSRAVIRCTHPNMFAANQLQRFEAVEAKAKLSLYGGDCFCYGQLSSGLSDAVIEAGLQTYDFMALVPVIEGAGGQTGDWQDRPLGLHSAGDVLMTGDPALRAEILEILQA